LQERLYDIKSLQLTRRRFIGFLSQNDQFPLHKHTSLISIQMRSPMVCLYRGSTVSPRYAEPFHLRICLQRRLSTSGTQRTRGSEGFDLGTWYYASLYRPPTLSYLRRLPTHCIPLRRAEAIFSYCLVYVSVTEGSTAGLWSWGQRDSLSLCHGS
jgi:hypothetical protein